MQVKQFVSDHVGMLLIFAVVLGLLVQPLAAVFYPLITPIIIILIALGFIKLDFSLLMQECRNWPIQLYLLLFGLIATPVLLYVLIDNAAYYISVIHHEHAVGALIFNGVSVGAAGPALVAVINGNFERAALNLVLSSVVMIITLPLLLYLLLPGGVRFSLTTMIVSLGVVMIPAIMIGFGVKQFLPLVVKYIEPKISMASVFLLMGLVLGCQSGLASLFFQNWIKTLSVFILAFLSCIIAALIGWYAHIGPLSKRNRICHSVVFYYCNFGLAIVIAHEWFSHSPETIYYVSIAVIPVCIMPAILKYWAGGK